MDQIRQELFGMGGCGGQQKQRTHDPANDVRDQGREPPPFVAAAPVRPIRSAAGAIARL